MEKKIDNLGTEIKKTSEKLVNFNNDAEDINDISRKFQNNKKQEYIKNWNSKLFLHKYNRDRPITLADAFIMPDYISHKIISSVRNLDEEELDIIESNEDLDIIKHDLDIILERFIQYEKTSIMLVAGIPGIGKSTITSWIANKYKDDNRYIILRFRDWASEELQTGILKAVYSTLECKKRELEDKILILDGFDEMKLLNIGEGLLKGFVNDIKDFNNFKCIITSRPAYINSIYIPNVIELTEFDIDKVSDFYECITGHHLINEEDIKSNLEVLGIPVILYMAIMSGVDITENPTKPELYNHIFAEDGGIFDRFFDGENEYSEGSHLMRHPDNIKAYLKFLKDVAFMMFARNTLSLKREDCEVPPLQIDGKMVNVLEFPIKHFFESTDLSIEFIHKSIYEYFVSENIFRALDDEIKTSYSIEHIAGILGEVLRYNNLSAEIIEFFRYRVNNSELKGKFDVINNVFRIMQEDGMTYYTEKRCKNVIDCEMVVFSNMLEILHVWDCNNLIYCASIDKYLKYSIDIVLNLQGMDLNQMKIKGVVWANVNLRNTKINEINLENVNLQEKNLEEIVWKKANLIGAILVNANLKGADLENSDFTGANLSNAILTNAILKRVDLIGANLQEAVLVGADLREASLYSANLINSRLENVIFDETNINESIWSEQDIYNILPNLKNTVFKYIIVEGESGERRKIHRRDLFPGGCN